MRERLGSVALTTIRSELGWSLTSRQHRLLTSACDLRSPTRIVGSPGKDKAPGDLERLIDAWPGTPAKQHVVQSFDQEALTAQAIEHLQDQRAQQLLRWDGGLSLRLSLQQPQRLRASAVNSRSVAVAERYSAWKSTTQ